MIPLLLVAASTLGVALPPAAEEEEKPRSARRAFEALARPDWETGDASIARAAERALADGLAYLARRLAESEDGALPVADGRREDYAPVGVTALGALAIKAAGSSPGRGPYGPEVDRILGYLLRHADLVPGSRAFGYISAQGDRLSRTHGHGFSTLVLAEAYGMTGAERLRPALIAAVRLIEGSQGSEGGWYYEPHRTAQHEGSVTICHVQALRAARNAGVAVDGQVIRRAEDYVRRLQKDDGTFRYQLDREDSSIALTAAAISTLNMAGRYDDAIIQNGIDAIWSGLGLADEGLRQRADFPHYERLYLAQALWQLSDPSHFRRWFEVERERIVRSQRKNGSWRGPRFGDCYATAVNCLVLATPEGVLPIFQR